jgi:cell division protein FtsB
MLLHCQEMDKSAVAIKKSEKEKSELQAKYNASQLSVISLYEERQAERAEMEKLQRQNAVLINLCKDLKSKAAGGATANAADEVAAVSTSTDALPASTAAADSPAAAVVPPS